MFITYKEVHEGVEALPEGTIVGICGDPHACIIAEAVKRKYPLVSEVAVSLVAGDVWIAARGAVTHIEKAVTTGDDGHKLYELARAFDDLDPRGNRTVKREEALELFQ